MLKKAGFVAAAAAGLMMFGGTAFAAPAMADERPGDSTPNHVTFQEAFDQFNIGGGALGYGAASLVSGAYTGILTTPQNLLDGLGH